jgi:ABC-2 type transport system ATP-binding protein
MSVKPGVTVLLGRNGAGKTTLCDVLAGVLAPDTGDVVVDGERRPADGPGLRDYRRAVGWLPQSPEMPRGMSCREYLAYAAWLKALPRSERRARVSQVLDTVGLADRRGDQVRSLSGGMQRRLGLAQALIADPTLLILDEPTAGLDPEQRLGFYRLVDQVRQTGCAVLLSTHLIEDAASVAEAMVVLDGGRVVFDGAPADLAGGAQVSEASLRAGFLAHIGDAT